MREGQVAHLASFRPPMIEFYPHIKMVHVFAVIASGLLFMLRGSLVQAGASWAMAAPLRYLSYGIDTVLLAAALMLLSVLPPAVFASGWLTLKLGLLVVYIVLGTYALKRGRTRRLRLGCYLSALLVYGLMYVIARSHDPLGPIRMIADALP